MRTESAGAQEGPDQTPGSRPEVGGDSSLAVHLARAAGDVLLAVRRDVEGLSDREIRDRGDAAAQEVLAAELARLAPDDAVLSEEAADDPVRLTRSRVWIIDPLDGTREYAEGRDDWAVHVALWVDGELTAGAVALPARGQVFTTSEARPAAERAPGPVRLAVSRSRPPALVHAVAAELAAELVPMGSAGVKTMAVVSGEVDAYVHAGGQYEWDSAAPVAVALAYGLHASRIDGTPLRYNSADPTLPDLVVCRPELRTVLMSAIRTAEDLEGTP